MLVQQKAGKVTLPQKKQSIEVGSNDRRVLGYRIRLRRNLHPDPISDTLNALLGSTRMAAAGARFDFWDPSRQTYFACSAIIVVKVDMDRPAGGREVSKRDGQLVH